MVPIAALNALTREGTAWCERGPDPPTPCPVPSAYRVLSMMLTASILIACASDTLAPPSVVDPIPPIVLQPATRQLPVLRITTASGAAITSKETYVPATMALTDSAGTEVVRIGLEIRGRGNTTWILFPKKPYRLRLASSTSLLGMPANRHWVLLANYSDKTFLRNELAFDFSRAVGMAWTPRARYVDVEVNGTYEGVYQLVEHIRIGPDRVNIQSMKASDTSATDVTGGYLLEVDERYGEEFCLNSTITRMVFCVVDPETLNQPTWQKQRAYLTSYLARTDSAIFGPQFRDPDRGYAAYIDVESSINYNIVQEVTKNVDGALRFSGFMYKPRGGKLIFGPVWDFDLAFGNVNYDGADQPAGWHSRRAQWYTRLFEDPAYVARFNARWAELKRSGALDSLQNLVRSRASYLSVVQVRNFERWPILGTYVWPNRVVTGSYAGEVTAMDRWLSDRISWMYGNIQN